MNITSLDGVFDAIKQLKVLIIGDAMIDIFSHGEVTGMSAEAPVPVLKIKSAELRPGGAANVALNVAALGAEPFLCSVVGADAAADSLSQLLASHHISGDYLIRSSPRRTTQKHRVLDAGSQLLRMDTEDDHELSLAESGQVQQIVDRLISQVHLVIIQDYDKGNLSESMIRYILDLSRKRHVPVAVDPKFRNFRHYAGVSLFKPNKSEFLRGINLEDDRNLELVAKKFQQEFPCEKLLLTLSEDGIYYCDTADSGNIPTATRQIVDVSGAGDTVIAIAAVCLALDLPLRIIAELANLGGGIVCEYQGVVAIDPNRLKAEALQNFLLGQSFAG